MGKANFISFDDQVAVEKNQQKIEESPGKREKISGTYISQPKFWYSNLNKHIPNWRYNTQIIRCQR
jgi:hypothetical protein